MSDEQKEWHELADPEMIYYCAKLNDIPGIETRQSCSGHKAGDISKSEGFHSYQTSGCVWLVCDWITHEVAFDLAEIATMERVQLIFFPGGEAIWDIVFKGKNRDCLDKSMEDIIRILVVANRILIGEK